MAPIPLQRRLARARAYLRAIGPAVEGNSGDEQTFRACKVGRRFDLTEEEFLPLLDEWNGTCSPPWPYDQLARKLRSTYRNTTVAPGAALGDDDHRDRPATAPAPPTYPPVREVQWLWGAALPLQAGASPAAAWILRMQLDPALLGLHPEIQCRGTPQPRAQTMRRDAGGALVDDGERY